MNLDIKKRAQNNGAADLAVGWLITPEFGSKGGAEVEINSQPLPGGGRKAQRVIRYDDPKLQKSAQTVINVARRVLRQWCAPSYAGLFFCPAAELADFDEELNPLRLESYALNTLARTLGSDRETVIEIFPSPIDTKALRVAIRVGQTIYQSLTRLKASITDAEKAADNRSEWRGTKNLHKLVTGQQHALVLEALRSMEDQRAAYGFEKVDLTRWNFAPIDRAIKTFEPAKDAFLIDPSE